jgi:type VI secretion system protein ImpG
MTDLRRLFEQEMRSLQEEGAQFAAEFPEAARLLDRESVEDRDPYVERVLEGTAFLMARVREVLQSDGDPLSEALLEQIAPDLLQPLPSIAVVEFALRPEAQCGEVLAEGVQILSDPVEGLASPLVFALSHQVVVDHATVRAAQVVQRDAGDGYLELELAWDDQDPAPAWPDKLDLYLHGDAPVVWAMRFALLRRCAGVEIRYDNSWHTVPGVSVERLERRSYNADRSEPSPFAQARDWLCSDERFRFVRIAGLNRTRISVPDSVKLRISFQGVMPRGWEKSVQAGLFRPRTGIALNRYRESCEPLVWDHTSTERRLRPIGGVHREILEVESVRGFTTHGSGGAEVYQRHGSYRRQSSNAFYQFRRGFDASGKPIARIAIGNVDASGTLREETLAVDGICCDGSIPNERLRPESLRNVRHDRSSVLLAGAITRPTPIYRAPQGSDKSRLLAFAAGHSDGWLDAGRLKDGLRHCMWDLSEAKRTLVESIQAVSVEHGQVVHKGVAWRQMRVSIRLRDTTCTPDTWDRLGQIDAMGSVLWAIVRDAVPIGSKGWLELTVEPAGVAMHWSDGFAEQP